MRLLVVKRTSIRLFVEDDLKENHTFSLSKEQSHYLIKVMRLKAGDLLFFFNGCDGEWQGRIVEASRKAVIIEILKQTQQQRKEPDLWLVFAPVKKARIDFIAEKATELGVSRLIPVMTHHTNVDRVKVERLSANAVEAAEQCERLTVPVVEQPQMFSQLLERWPENRQILFCDENKSGEPLLSALADNKREKSQPWAIFIGPEGGWSEEERQVIRSKDETVVVSLGPRVLRADTAMMAAVVLWQSFIGDWSE